MKLGSIVHAHYSLPFRQAVKLTFFAPFIWRISAEENIPFSPDIAEKQVIEDKKLTSIETSMF